MMPKAINPPPDPGRMTRPPDLSRSVVRLIAFPLPVGFRLPLGFGCKMDLQDPDPARVENRDVIVGVKCPRRGVRDIANDDPVMTGIAGRSQDRAQIPEHRM